jgi:hypothetical protein
MKRNISAVALLMLLTAWSEAHASLIVFTDRSSFDAVSTSNTVIDFEGIAPAGGLYDTCGSITQSGVQFVLKSGDGLARCGEGFVISSSYPPAGQWDWGTGDSLHGDRFGFFQSSGTPIGYIEAVLPANTYAVGTDYTLSYANGNRVGSVLFDVLTGATDYQFTLSVDTTLAAAFEGFISTDPITSLQFRTLGVNGDNSPYGGLDNFAIGTVASVPEPGTWGMMALSVAALALWRRRASIARPVPIELQPR